jgi:hypothetical protein
VIDMKKLLMLTTAGIITASTLQPGFAAPRAKRTNPTQAMQLTDYGSNPGFNSYSRGQVAPVQAYPSGNLPYPDRPWGAPNRH